MYCTPAEENHDIDMSYCAWPTGGCVHQYLLYVKRKKLHLTTNITTTTSTTTTSISSTSATTKLATYSLSATTFFRCIQVIIL